MLRATAAGNRAEGRLELREDRGLARRETHVARQCELASGGAHTPFDLRDGHRAAGAQMAEEQGAVVGLDALDRRDEIAHELRPEQVHGRSVDLREHHRWAPDAIGADADAFLSSAE
jgi:hypothetical protein